MSAVERAFHERWLGLIQPSDGLVVSVPVLVDAQAMARRPAEVWHRLVELCPNAAIADLPRFLGELLDLDPSRFDVELPDDLALYVPEGKQTLRPTLALKLDDPPTPPTGPEATTAAVAGSRYLALLWDLPPEVDLDKPETATGPWEYPPTAKLDRLLRHCRVPIGLLTNRRELRLIYAPHGEASGHLTFRFEYLIQPGDRHLLDALCMLLSAHRLYGAAPEHRLPALLAESRLRQANVTNDLADQVFEALHALLRGFEAAADRDGRPLPVAGADERDTVYEGLLTVLLRLVFLLYAEDRGLLPMDRPTYQAHLSVLGLFAQLRDDAAAFPDAMARRFGAWPRLVTLFRAVFLGVEHGDLRIPARRGELFDPHRFPFLEGWTGGSAPVDPLARAATPVPTVDDGAVLEALHRLLYLDGQRLSYKTLDVEQIGSVYERLMGYRVVRLGSPAVCLAPHKTWVTATELLAVPARQRARWLQDEAGLTKRDAGKLQEGLLTVTDPDAALAVLRTGRASKTGDGRPGALVVQPTPERRRTSSHYTPRSLTAPIVDRTLGPLVAAMGAEPSSERLLELKICDPAMGSGAFLVEACRWLADQLVAAWTREGRLEWVADAHEDVVNHARRLVAQRCLYGVDKNPLAVTLAKLSLWLVTLARDLPFTFVDHALRHGDSLVGLDLEQIQAFHWKPTKQLTFVSALLQEVLDQAIVDRQKILELAESTSPAAWREKVWLLQDAADALEPVRIVGDLVVGAFFSAEKDRDREKERVRRMELVRVWLEGGGPVPDELRAMSDEIRARIPVFHWMAEFPEVFWAERPDPIAEGKADGVAWMEAFVGNPPFAGGGGISGEFGPAYLAWLLAIHEGSHGNSDLSAHFFRRTARLLGAHGTIGLLATNTIAQGDTRSTGLQRLVADGFAIGAATRSMPWPGDSAVSVSVVHLGKGTPTGAANRRVLDGTVVMAIDSRLRAKPERADPVKLASNQGLTFLGTKIYGNGFTITASEREALVAKCSRNAERVFPYLGGEEVNTSPDQGFDRFVISFGNMSLDEAAQWPDLLAIVREKVKPERDQLKDNPDGRRRKQYWWQFGRETPALYRAIRLLPRCLATSIHSKHLLFSWQPTDRVFSHALYAVALSSDTAFAILQSRVHAPWARLFSSSLEDRLRYSAEDCFGTYPFAASDPAVAIQTLEDIGRRLDTVRSAFLVANQVGLTTCYNRLTDPANADSQVVALRELHLELDSAVLAAYGWSDIPVPPYTTPETDLQLAALGSFEDEIVDRLFVLNAERAALQALLGPTQLRKPRHPLPAPSDSALPFAVDSETQ